MKYLLDTSIISELISKEPNQKVLEYINSLNEEDVYLSVVTLGEIEFSIAKLPKNSKKQQKLQEWFKNALLPRFQGRVIDINLETMLLWGEITAKLQKKGKTIAIMDALIASTAMSKDYTLITRNEKDFENFDIEIINPFKL